MKINLLQLNLYLAATLYLVASTWVPVDNIISSKSLKTVPGVTNLNFLLTKKSQYQNKSITNQ